MIDKPADAPRPQKLHSGEERKQAKEADPTEDSPPKDPAQPPSMHDASMAALTEELSRLSMDITKALTEISGKLARELSLLEEASQAVAAKSREMERLHKIDVVATSIETLVRKHEALKLELETEQAQARHKWEQEAARSNREHEELMAALQRRREEEKATIEAEQAAVHPASVAAGECFPEPATAAEETLLPEPAVPEAPAASAAQPEFMPEQAIAEPAAEDAGILEAPLPEGGEGAPAMPAYAPAASETSTSAMPAYAPAGSETSTSAMPAYAPAGSEVVTAAMPAFVPYRPEALPDIPELPFPDAEPHPAPDAHVAKGKHRESDAESDTFSLPDRLSAHGRTLDKLRRTLEAAKKHLRTGRSPAGKPKDSAPE